MSMERGLRSGLKNGEFELHYQPELSLSQGRVNGCEALIRWRMSGGELAQPASFIAAAEESGLIVPIGLWAVHEACRQSRCWALDGLMRLPVAVNISAAQFHGHGFVDDIAAILRDTRLPPPLLELELAETTLMRDVDAAIEELRLLRSMGVRVAIDDFGTGYCGLAYLKRLPVEDTLKIDQSFVHDVPQQRNDAENRVGDRAPGAHARARSGGRGRGDGRPSRIPQGPAVRYRAGLSSSARPLTADDLARFVSPLRAGQAFGLRNRGAPGHGPCRNTMPHVAAHRFCRQANRDSCPRPACSWSTTTSTPAVPWRRCSNSRARGVHGLRRTQRHRHRHGAAAAGRGDRPGAAGHAGRGGRPSPAQQPAAADGHLDRLVGP
jgi:EAL domain-containing protein (putative c-di-GMP-specific phosphodiesterase class I)